MPAAGRSQRYGIVAASVAVHAVLLALVALHTPRLKVPPQESGPPQAVIPILIVPRVPPPTTQPGAKPTEIRLHRRPQRFADEPPPIKPFVAPTTEEVRRAPPAEGVKTVNPSQTGDAVGANARNALRGKLGCANATLLGLSRAEREACEDQLARGARDAPFAGLGLERGKAGDLAAAAARKERDVNYRLATPPGTTGAGPSANGNAVGRGNNLPGSTAEGLGAMVGSDRPTLKVPF